MFVALYVYGAEFRMISYDTEEEAKQSIIEHFDELIEENRFNPEADEAFVFEKIANSKDMPVVFSTRDLEKYTNQ